MSNSRQKVQPASANRLLIVGLGNGGCKIAAFMASQWGESAGIVAIDTGDVSPVEVEGIKYLQIGKSVMRGMGTGGEPQVGRRAAEVDIDAIRHLLQNVDVIFLIVALGGGTGTGATPLIVEEAGRRGILTLCFVTLPFHFEGKRRMDRAEQGMVVLNEVADAVICLPNQRLYEMVDAQANINQAFAKVDEMLSQGVQSLWRVLSRQGVINLDLSHLRTLIRSGSGRCVFGCAQGTGSKKIEMVLKGIRENPLLNHGQVLADAHGYLVSIVSGPDFSLKENDELMQGIAGLGSQGALTMTGIVYEPEWRNKVFVTILACERATAPISPRAVQPAADRDTAKPEPAVKSVMEQESKQKITQTTFFDGAAQGRFKGIDPTIVDGNNLDIPTFKRRGILIQKVRDNND